MHLRPRHASLVAAAALAASTLAMTPAANAVPVFVDADTHLQPYSGAYTANGTCTTTENTASPNTDVPVVENGPVATSTSFVTASSTDGGPVIANLSAQSTATGSVKSVGGNPSVMDFALTGTSTNDFLAASTCELHAYAGSDLDFSFTVAQGGFLHLSFKSNGGGYSEVYIEKQDSGSLYPYYDHYGRGLKFSGDETVYLPAGTYEGYFEGEVDNRSTADQTVSATTSVHATFAVAGSQTEAVSGKGKKYTTLPAARSCATDSLDATVTAKKKRAEKIKQITYFVNDAKVKKVKKVKKGQVVKVPVADDVAADLTAEVTLFPRKKGKPAKTYEVSASYEACS